MIRSAPSSLLLISILLFAGPLGVEHGTVVRADSYKTDSPGLETFGHTEPHVEGATIPEDCAAR